MRELAKDKDDGNPGLTRRDDFGLLKPALNVQPNLSHIAQLLKQTFSGPPLPPAGAGAASSGLRSRRAGAAPEPGTQPASSTLQTRG